MPWQIKCFLLETRYTICLRVLVYPVFLSTNSHYIFCLPEFFSNGTQIVQKHFILFIREFGYNNLTFIFLVYKFLIQSAPINMEHLANIHMLYLVYIFIPSLISIILQFCNQRQEFSVSSCVLYYFFVQHNMNASNFYFSFLLHIHVTVYTQFFFKFSEPQGFIFFVFILGFRWFPPMDKA